MIIIKTKNGDKFVNDKNIISLEHDRERKTVSYWPIDGNGRGNGFLDVESVIYINDAQPTQWMDEGSEVEKLQETLSNRNKDAAWLNEMLTRYKSLLRDFASEMIQIVNYNDGQIALETANRIRDRSEEMKEHANSNLFALRHEYNEKNNACKNVFDIIDEQNIQIADLKATIKELYKKINQTKTENFYEIRRIYERTLWERITNKAV